jgi:hypothetical protein
MNGNAMEKKYCDCNKYWCIRLTTALERVRYKGSYMVIYVLAGVGECLRHTTGWPTYQQDRIAGAMTKA